MDYDFDYQISVPDSATVLLCDSGQCSSHLNLDAWVMNFAGLNYVSGQWREMGS